MSHLDQTQARVLIVDDEPANVLLLERVLQHAGFVHMRGTSDPSDALGMFVEYHPDIVLLDLRMPQLDGFEVMERIRAHGWGDDHVPILILTADVTRESLQRALSVGAKDFLTKPFDAEEVVLRIKNLIETRFLHLRLKEQNNRLEESVRARTTDLWKAVTRLEESERELSSSRDETIQRLAIAAEFRHDETSRHVQRMSRYCALLARLTGESEKNCELIRVASLLHDVGKIGIPDSILLKPAAFTVAERSIMERHAHIGFRMLHDSVSPLLELACTIAHTHHEKVDGSGYPRSLKGEVIPLVGRIAAIADVFDALTSNRVYRPAFDMKRAVEIMRMSRGGHLDPDLLDLFLEVMDEVLLIRHEYADDNIRSGEQGHFDLPSLRPPDWKAS